MLKLKAILFIALAATVGGVYAAWSYPTYVGTYTSDVTVPIEIETPTLEEINLFDVTISGLSVKVGTSNGSDSNIPEVSLQGYVSVSGELPEGLDYEQYEDFTMYIEITGLRGVSQYQTEEGPVDIFNYPTQKFSFGSVGFYENGGECYQYCDFFDIFDEELAISINSNIVLDTYEKYQAFVDCFEDPCFEMTITIE